MKTSVDSQINRNAEVVLLSGFLGSGKTTLLKHILSWETDLSDTVVIVNEFGKIGIDGALLRESGSEVVELTSGCICCTLQVDLKHTIKQVLERFHPRQILIEASGIADPATIASVINDSGAPAQLKLKKIVTVLDSECWKAREAFGTVFYNQLNLADLILLNKIDLLDKDEPQLFLTQIHDTVPHCRVVPTVHCRIDPETILADVAGKDTKLPVAHYTGIHLIDSSSPEGNAHRQEDGSEKNHDHGRKTADANNYIAFSFQDQRTLDETYFKHFIANLPWELFRLKGPVRFQDRTVLINFVGGKSDWQDWRGAPETRLTFIGWDVNEAEIIKRLKNCLVET